MKRAREMFELDNGTLQTVLQELEQAAAKNERWHDRIIRTLVCELPCEERELAGDAHRRCSFGRWWAGEASRPVRAHPAFAALDREHRLMHQAAARLLRAACAGARPRTQDYDEFVRRHEAMRQAMAAVRHEVEGALTQRDPLTGARTRANMTAELQEQQELVRRGMHSCCIAFMDLDHFKAVNDRYGHPTGDQVLSACARYVREHVRPFDKVFRYGGEEFVIAMPGADLHTGCRIVERIRAGLAELVLASPEGAEPVRCTVSFGLTMLEADLPVDVAIERADQAMYQAKQRGRNRVEIYRPPAGPPSRTG